MSGNEDEEECIQYIVKLIHNCYKFLARVDASTLDDVFARGKS